MSTRSNGELKALAELLKLAEEAVKNGKNLLANQKIARLDIVQLEIERERSPPRPKPPSAEFPPPGVPSRPRSAIRA